MGPPQIAFGEKAVRVGDKIPIGKKHKLDSLRQLFFIIIGHGRFLFQFIHHFLKI